jgi:hypothetical protein
VMEAMYISTPRDATDVIWMKMFIDELAEAWSASNLDLYFENSKTIAYDY